MNKKNSKSQKNNKPVITSVVVSKETINKISVSQKDIHSMKIERNSNSLFKNGFNKSR